MDLYTFVAKGKIQRDTGKGKVIHFSKYNICVTFTTS